jgi:heme/flavin dehydrogenase (mycofactocin system)
VASSKGTFETVAEAERRARQILPKFLYVAIKGGVESGISLADNQAAFNELRLLPKIATGLSGPRDQATTLLGQELALPVYLSPTGAQSSIRPGGELASARAAAAAGTAFGVSSFSSTAIEEIVKVNPLAFHQMFWLGSREKMEAIVERARNAGAKALIVTLDFVFAHRKDWGTPLSIAHLPNPSRAQLARYYGGQMITSPKWLYGFLRERILPQATVPNLGTPEQPDPPFFPAFIEWMQTPPPTWADIAWLREEWGGPFVVKGIAHPDDARQAVDAGATAIAVSNYGGGNLDGTPATIRLLPAIVDAVGGQVEIVLDGGIQRGSDVVKAIALGARAVGIGRSFLWGLTVNGEAGVTNVLQIIRSGIDETLNGLGRASIHDVTADDVVVPDGFAASRAPQLA